MVPRGILNVQPTHLEGHLKIEVFDQGPGLFFAVQNDVSAYLG
jgi:hypothetical protein